MNIIRINEEIIVISFTSFVFWDLGTNLSSLLQEGKTGEKVLDVQRKTPTQWMNRTETLKHTNDMQPKVKSSVGTDLPNCLYGC